MVDIARERPIASDDALKSPGLRRLLKADPVLVLCLALGALLVGAAILAPVLSPHGPDAQRLLARLKPPVGFGGTATYLLGSDQLGRDILSRCLYGLRLTLLLAAFGALVGLLAGAAAGMVAWLAGGVIDHLVMGMCDVKLSMPFTLVALLVIAVAGADLVVLVIVLGLAYWAHFARLIRAQVMALRELPFIEAARAAGASGWRIAFKHMLPNIVSPVIVMLTLNFSNLILLESSLSFLGLGVQPPTATLGSDRKSTRLNSSHT